MLLDHKFPPDTRVENEIEALKKAGHKIHLACFSNNNKPELEITTSCIIHRRRISSIRFKSSVGALKFPFYLNFWRKFTADLMNKLEIEAVHVHDLPLAKIGYELKEKYKIKFILDLHENWPVLLQLSKHTNTLLGKILSSNKQWIRYEKKFASKADAVIVVVDEAKKRLANLGVDNDKIFVVSNTLNLSQFDPISKNEFSKEGLRLLYVGGINYHRGLQYVLKAINILNKKGIKVKFDIVGDGSYLPKIKELALNLNLSENINFHGYKKFTEILDVYNSADIAMIPHIKSGHTDNTIPHKIFQYMYAQIPIVTSNCDPLVRIVEENYCGVSYTFDNPAELSEIIARFAKNKELLYEYIKHGKKAVVEKYNWKNDSKTLCDLYAYLSEEA